MPEERRRHLSAAGGLPLALLEESRYSSRRFRKIRGLDALPAVARAVAVDRLDLGFVDILSTEGRARPSALGPDRRAVLAARAAGQRASRRGAGSRWWTAAVVASVGAAFAFKPRRPEPDPEAVAAILDQIGLGPNGRPWDCRACGFDTCQRFAEAAALGRASHAAVHAVPGAPGGRGPAGGGGGHDDRASRPTGCCGTGLAFEVERGKRSAEGFAVLFLDLDRFKEVNDQFGHEAGNEILRAVAGEIRNAVRASDVAARYGGDEFVVILTRTDLQGGARVAEALRAGIEGVGRRLGYPAGLITVSIGLAEFNPGEPAEADLLVSADRALYRAKAAGRNAVA